MLYVLNISIKKNAVLLTVSTWKRRLKSAERAADNIQKGEKVDSYVGKPLPRNPLALAALYKEGLGRLWQNQKQAADALTRFGVKREDVNRALRLSSMPTDALMLFADCGINGRTARELIRIERAIGRAALEERAQAIAKEGKSRTELVQMLDDQSPVPPKRRRTPQVDLPSIRAQQYVNGIATNKWSTMTEAAKTEGWGKEMLFKSTMLAGLPPVITSLFEQKRFPFETVKRCSRSLEPWAFQRSPRTLGSWRSSPVVAHLNRS